jgi:hypothetical protein
VGWGIRGLSKWKPEQKLKDYDDIEKVALSTDDSMEILKRSYYHPLYFIQTVFPWGKEGKLKNAVIEDWQVRYMELLSIELIRRAKEPGKHQSIRIAVGSGNYTGTAVMGIWLILWFIFTRRIARGGIVVPTNQQVDLLLEEMAMWLGICSISHNLILERDKIIHCIDGCWNIKFYNSNRIEKIPDIVQGFHGEDLIWIFDQASHIYDVAWTAINASTCGDRNMFFAFGNISKADGIFHKCWRSRDWITMNVDSRSIKNPLINNGWADECVKEYGLEHDYVRVHVLGLPPQGEAVHE